MPAASRIWRSESPPCRAQSSLERMASSGVTVGTPVAKGKSTGCRRANSSDADAWRFPVGTTFWKEFAWGGRKVETRMIRLLPHGEWGLATYVWNEEQTDAMRAPDEGVPAAYEIAPGVRHSIPAAADCRVCHASSPATVLGFTAPQLSDDRDPLAPHAEPLSATAITLRTLVDEGRVSPARSDWVSRPPRIRETDPDGRAALGYLSANCGGCHNRRGPLARLGLDLLHDSGGAPDSPEPGVRTTIGAASKFMMPGRESSTVIAPGAPELSVLLHRMESRSPSAQMPPLGSVVEDHEAIELVRRWVSTLGAPAATARAAGR